jgi:tetrahydromethanopterin S-methyltransferase subunit F
MDLLLGQVQDRVCNEARLLDEVPLNLGSKLREAAVWGIDSSTRRMIEMAIEDAFEAHGMGIMSDAADSSVYASITAFIEKRLLPAINAQKPEQAHLLSSALKSIVADSSSPFNYVYYAEAVLRGIDRYGLDYFRVHPKGTGVICDCLEGIPAHVFVTEYLGELYPPYRWCEKLDVIDQAQKTFNLKPTLPDFWNILLERPKHDELAGYGLVFVDASAKANLGSTCSHSCDSNCTSNVVARNGRLTIALTSNRFIAYGEELTMDYYSVTSSEVEWKAAVCLCGTSARTSH